MLVIQLAIIILICIMVLLFMEQVIITNHGMVIIITHVLLHTDMVFITILILAGDSQQV